MMFDILKGLGKANKSVNEFLNSEKTKEVLETIKTQGSKIVDEFKEFATDEPVFGEKSAIEILENIKKVFKIDELTEKMSEIDKDELKENVIDTFERFKKKISNINIKNVQGTSLLRDDDKNYYIEALLPGIVKEELSIDRDLSNLTITSSKEISDEESSWISNIDETYDFSEYTDCNLDSISSTLNDGILTVTIPKMNQTPKQSINID